MYYLTTLCSYEQQRGLHKKLDLLANSVACQRTARNAQQPLPTKTRCYCSGQGLTADYCPRAAHPCQDSLASLCPSDNIYSLVWSRPTSILWDHICMICWHFATEAKVDSSFASDACNTACNPPVTCPCTGPRHNGGLLVGA